MTDGDIKDNNGIVKLGGNIELSGFRVFDGGTMLVLKKIIGNYARKFSDRSSNFELLSLHVKTIHETEQSKIFEVHAKLIDNGTLYTSQVAHRNSFVAVDSVLKKLGEQG